MQPSTSYRYTCLIPFHLADPAGVLFFGHAFTLFHQAFESFVIHQLHCPWTFWFQHPEWIVPIKRAEGEYLCPILAGQQCHIELVVSSLSTSSFVLVSSFYQNQLCCLVKTVHVFCSRLTRQTIPIPCLNPSINSGPGSLF